MNTLFSQFLFRSSRVALALLLLVSAVLPGVPQSLASAEDGTIDPNNADLQYAWSSEAGWINFEIQDVATEIHITDAGISGFAWSENFGWINMAPTQEGVFVASDGDLSGYAWGENLGWIDFANAYIDDQGYFGGTATGTGVGTINFDCADCTVQTDYIPDDYRGGGRRRILDGPSAPDIDGDGIPNESDPDMDGDGINNVFDEDTDGDGASNGIDSDDDGDGQIDGSDSSPTGPGTPSDIDGDGVNNVFDDDMDGDGIPNSEDNDRDGDGVPEFQQPLPVDRGSLDDLDGDGIPNDQDPDKDGDGIPNVNDDDPNGDGLPGEVSQGAAPTTSAGDSDVGSSDSNRGVVEQLEDALEGGSASGSGGGSQVVLCQPGELDRDIREIQGSIAALERLFSWVYSDDYEVTSANKNTEKVVEDLYFEKNVVRALGEQVCSYVPFEYSKPEMIYLENLAELSKALVLSFRFCFDESSVQSAVAQDMSGGNEWWKKYDEILLPFWSFYFNEVYSEYDGLEGKLMSKIVNSLLLDFCPAAN